MLNVNLIGAVDGEGHIDNGVAAVGGGEGDRLSSGFIEDNIVPLVGQCSGANGLLNVNLIGAVDGEGHIDDGVAAVGGGESDGLCSGRAERDAVPLVRQCSRADSHRIVNLVGAIDGEGHIDDGVAAVGGGEGDGLRTRRAESNTIPNVR